MTSWSAVSFRFLYLQKISKYQVNIQILNSELGDHLAATLTSWSAGAWNRRSPYIRTYIEYVQSATWSTDSGHFHFLILWVLNGQIMQRL